LTDSGGDKYCTTSEIYELEQSIIQLLNNFFNQKETMDSDDYEKVITQYEKEKDIELNEGQINAIHKIVNNSPLVFLTGYPGTGKSTIIKLIYDYYDGHGYTLLFTALSGMAVSKIAQVLKLGDMTQKHYIGTICKLFMYELHKLAEGKSPPQIIIVDEASMIDYLLFKRILLYAKKHDCKIILVGDPQQLPPIGIGQLFLDIIKSNRFEGHHLYDIMRQKENNQLLRTISSIGDGNFSIKKGINNDCLLIDIPDHKIINQLRDTLNKYDMTDENCLVLSAQKNGDLGVHKLNALLQGYYGKNKKQKIVHSKCGYDIFCEDKLQRIKNDYDDPDGIQYNGDFSVINLTNGKMVIKRLWDEKTFYIKEEEIKDDFTLGYATTIHKSQGSESEYIIIILPTSHKFMWEQYGRKLLYTAISRAKEKCIIIGNPNLLMTAYHSNTEITTYFNIK
jgi:exodeoxyribonuclease V alpha subunit